jgi:hypothetical protein
LGGEPSGPGSETIFTFCGPNAATTRSWVVSMAKTGSSHEMTSFGGCAWALAADRTASASDRIAFIGMAQAPARAV